MTRAVEDALPLAQDLRTRGFVVQIVSPDQVAADPVDLEVILEECEPEAALRQADATPEADDLHVFVAPGALTDGPRPIQVIPLIPEAPVAKVEVPKFAKPEHVEQVAQLEESAMGPPAAANPLQAVPAPAPTPVAQTRPEVTQPLAVVETVAEKPKPQEMPILSPEVWGPRVLEPVPVSPKSRKPVSYRVVAQEVGAWLERAGASNRMLLRAAMVVAIASVAAMSMLVLGSTSHSFSAMPAQVESASETPQAPAHVVSVVSKPHPRPAVAPVRVATPKQRSHNPEEDIVAKDFVIRYKQPPASLTAKKNSGIKHYSDMR